MEKTLIVHFGAGALGRGLVIPILVESGCEVVIVDTNHSYEVDLTDDPEGRIHTIPIREALSPVKNAAEVARYLLAAKTVTTSVRRENLIYVARALAPLWGEHPEAGRRVLCCENVEHVGEAFSELLLGCAENEAQHRSLRSVAIPDTIVDRICSANWPSTSLVTSERFFELAVAKSALPDTGIKLIPSVDRIDAAFARKRFLVNTYADAVSFFALRDGCRYLYDAVGNVTINAQIEPYMGLLKRLLVLAYDYTPEDLETWAEKYKRRLANPAIPRDLHTVARGLWQKLSPGERFVLPIIELMKRGEPMEDGVRFLAELILAGEATEEQPLGRDELLNRLETLWAESAESRQLFQWVKPRLNA